MDSGSEIALSYFGRKDGTGSMTAATLQLVAAIFRFDRSNIRNVEGLVSERSRGFVVQIGIQLMAALFTGRRIEVLDMIHLLSGQQFPFLAPMPRLSSRLARAGLRFISDHPGPIRRRWF